MTPLRLSPLIAEEIEMNWHNDLDFRTRNIFSLSGNNYRLSPL